MKSYFGVGKIYKHSDNMMRYKVSSIKELMSTVIPHFEKYPLMTGPLLASQQGTTSVRPRTSEDKKEPYGSFATWVASLLTLNCLKRRYIF